MLRLLDDKEGAPQRLPAPTYPQIGGQLDDVVEAMPAYAAHFLVELLDVIDRAGHANLKIEYDLYHMQIMEGDLVNTLQENLNRIGNIQFADTPGRHEPGTGEIDYDTFLTALDEMGYANWVACEYIPSGATLDGLGWMQKWL